MSKSRLGKTEIITNKNGFGALPIQRISKEEAARLLRKAFDSGITFFDTARSYTDSEEKIGYALSDVRNEIFIATKTPSSTPEGFWNDLNKSLELLKTDYVDIFQFHNPAVCPLPGDELYECMVEAKKQGKIRFIGITNHRLSVAKQAIAANCYDTMQFPFSYLATEADIEIVNACAEADMGFIAMKALSGGLITNPHAAAAFFADYPNVVPIWGVQRESELDDFIKFVDNYPELTAEDKAVIESDKAMLSGNFCRGCGYCEVVCPAKIEISNCARMSLLLRRSPSQLQLTDTVQRKMKNIENCIDCGSCKAKCPYGLDTPNLLKENLKDYLEVLDGKPL